MILRVNSDISSNSINPLIFVVEKRCVFFEVRTWIFKYYLDDLRLEGVNKFPFFFYQESIYDGEIDRNK
jgi:hypothetical protein